MNVENNKSYLIFAELLNRHSGNIPIPKPEALSSNTRIRMKIRVY